MRNCPECGAILVQGESVCRQCGCGLTDTGSPAGFCQRCKSPLEVGAAHCPVCGIPIKREGERYCPVCGNKLPADAKSCPSCGKTLRSKKIGWRLLLLLPALLFSLYLILVETGIGGEDLDLFALRDGVAMSILGILCYAVLPVVFILTLMFRGSSAGSRREENGDKPIWQYNGKLGASGHDAPGGESVSAIASDLASKLSDDGAAHLGGSDWVRAEDIVPRASYSALQSIEREYPVDRSSNAAKDIKPIDAEKVSDDLSVYMAGKGIDVPYRVARAIISAIASDRVIIVEANDKERAKRVMTCVAEYFGGSLHPYKVDRGCGSSAALSVDGSKNETGLLIDAYTAACDRERVRFAYLEDVEPSECGKYLGELLYAIEHKYDKLGFTVEEKRSGVEMRHLKDGKAEVSQNLRLIVSPVFGSDISLMTENAVVIELSEVSERKAVPYSGQPEAVSDRQLFETLKVKRESKYLSEELWKKLDELFEYLGKHSSYYIGNRKIRLMESYSSMYMTCGGSEGEALDDTLAACVIRELYLKKAVPVTEEGEENLIEMLERLFGSETVPYSIETARKLYYDGGFADKAIKGAERRGYNSSEDMGENEERQFSGNPYAR